MRRAGRRASERHISAARAEHLRLVGQQFGQHQSPGAAPPPTAIRSVRPPTPAASRSRTRRRPPQDGGQPRAEVVAVRQQEWDAGVSDPPLGADQPLGHGGGFTAKACAMAAASTPSTVCSISGVRSSSRRRDEHRPASAPAAGRVSRTCRRLRSASGFRRAGRSSGRRATSTVAQPVACHREKPSLGIDGNPVLGPPGQRPFQRVGQCVLGGGDIAGGCGQQGEQPTVAGQPPGRLPAAGRSGVEPAPVGGVSPRHRADFDRTPAAAGIAVRPFDRLVEIVDLDDEDAAELSLVSANGPSWISRCAVTGGHRRGRVDRFAAPRCRSARPPPIEVVGVGSKAAIAGAMSSSVRPISPAFLVVHQQAVTHGVLLDSIVTSAPV